MVDPAMVSAAAAAIVSGATAALTVHRAIRRAAGVDVDRPPAGYWWAKHAPDWVWQRWLRRHDGDADRAIRRAYPSTITFERDDQAVDVAVGADSVTRAGRFARALSDTASGTDSVTRAGRFARALSDTASGTDAGPWDRATAIRQALQERAAKEPPYSPAIEALEYLER